MPGKNFSGGGSFYRQGGKLSRVPGGHHHHPHKHQRNGSSGSDNSSGVNGSSNGSGTGGSNHFYRGGNNENNMAVREAHKNKVKLDSYLADDENFPSFKVQLAQMGLELRDIPADGNCLFRALGDQLEGHCRNHFRHRSSVVNFMRENKPDFEPFVEDEVSFEIHLSHLQRLGTHAGNDAIVAFARLHSSIVVIHQLNGKPLMIQGATTSSNLTRQFHIAYHNGDHYSSVRRQGDNTESPAHIRIEDAFNMGGAAAAGAGLAAAGKFPQKYYKDFQAQQNGGGGGGYQNGMVSARRGLEDIEHEVILATSCNDVERVRESLMECDYDVDLAIADILQQLELVGGEGDSASLASQHNSSDSGICPNSPTLSSNTIITSNGDEAFSSDNNNNNTDSNNNDTNNNSNISNGGEKTPTSVLKNRNGSSSSNGKGHKVHFREDSYGGSSGYGSMSSNKGAKPKMMSDRKTKEMKKQEKKRRAEEAKRQKHLNAMQGNNNNSNNNNNANCSINGVPYHPDVRDVTVVAFQDGRMTKI